MSVWTNFVFNCLCFVYCWPGQAAIDICHFSKKKSTFILFSGGLLHWGAPVLQLPAADERDDAQVEQHLDRSHGYSQAPHLLLLLPEPDQVTTSSKTEEENLFDQVCPTRPPAHASPPHPQHKSLLCDPGKSRLWKFKVQSKIPKFISCFCTYKGNADILMVFTFNFLGAKVNLPRRELRAHSSSCRPCVPSLSGWLSFGCHCHW